MKILFAGRLVDFKDPITFVKASILLPEHKFFLAGSGVLMEECKKLAPKNLKILGHITQLDVNSLMNNCDIFCQLSPYENIWASSLIGAMKHNLAIICTDSGLTKKFLSHNTNSLLIPSRSYKALVSAIRELEEPKTRMKLVQNAKDYYNKNLSVDSICKNVQEIIHNTCLKTKGMKDV
jgi:glycosyltransferase involved in cell wall biosynthesis